VGCPSISASVSACFKNIGQTNTLIEMMQNRGDIEEIAGVNRKSRFAIYNLELQDVLTGTPHGSAGNASGGYIDAMLNQLGGRQVAMKQVRCFSWLVCC
jgi:hypothetical protein